MECLSEKTQQKHSTQHHHFSPTLNWRKLRWNETGGKNVRMVKFKTAIIMNEFTTQSCIYSTLKSKKMMYTNVYKHQ